MKQPAINTQRLLLRAFDIKDARQVQMLAGNYNVANTTLNIPHPYENGVAEIWIKSHADGWRNKTHISYAIVDKQTNQLLGAISLIGIEAMQAKLGYWIGEDYWGRGFCTEAARGIIDFSFSVLGIKKIVAEHLSNNPASGKVMRKCGMSYIGSNLAADRDHQMVSIEIYEIQGI